jgi:hypothetical protein
MKSEFLCLLCLVFFTNCKKGSDFTTQMVNVYHNTHAIQVFPHGYSIDSINVLSKPVSNIILAGQPYYYYSPSGCSMNAGGALYYIGSGTEIDFLNDNGRISNVYSIKNFPANYNIASGYDNVLTWNNYSALTNSVLDVAGTWCNCSGSCTSGGDFWGKWVFSIQN